MTSSPNMKYHVNRIVIHDGYSKATLETDDLALLRLNRSVEVSGNSSIRLPRLPESSMLSTGGGYSCKAAGWGKDKEFGSVADLYSDSSLPSLHLQEIAVPLITTQACIHRLKDKSEMLKNRTAFAMKLLCGGGERVEDGTACLHDSGSPFVCRAGGGSDGGGGSDDGGSGGGDGSVSGGGGISGDGVSDSVGLPYLHGVAIAIHGPYIDQNPCKPGNQTIIFIKVSHYVDWLTNITNERQNNNSQPLR